jgi:integrase
MIRVFLRNSADRRYIRMYYIDPETDREVVRSAKTSVVREAERAAAAWEVELRAGRGGDVASWEAFRQRFEDEYLASRPKSTQTSYLKAFNHFERLVGTPKQMTTVTTSLMSRFASDLRTKGGNRGAVGPTTVNSTLRHLRAALRWGARMGMLPVAPVIEMQRIAKRRLARGRAVTNAEFAAILKAVPEVVGKRLAAEWARLLRGIWLSGMRLSEAMIVSWTDAPVRVTLDTTPPRTYWHSEGHKARNDQVIPMTPDFAALLAETPHEDRTGVVFDPKIPGRVVEMTLASKTISAIGRKAGVFVSEDRSKPASAHDLRRSFGQRWALKVPPLVLKTLMRHKSMETTMSYYVDLELDDIAPFLWAGESNAAVSGPPSGPPPRIEPKKIPSKTPRKSLVLTP